MRLFPFFESFATGSAVAGFDVRDRLMASADFFRLIGPGDKSFPVSLLLFIPAFWGTGVAFGRADTCAQADNSRLREPGFEGDAPRNEKENQDPHRYPSFLLIDAFRARK